MTERTRADELHALAWQATAEMSRQVALIWAIAYRAMPAGPDRTALAEAVVQFGAIARMQDVTLSDLTQHLPVVRIPDDGSITEIRGGFPDRVLRTITHTEQEN